MSSATSQGRGGGDPTARGASSSTNRARSSFRGSRSQADRGRGRGRGGADASVTSRTTTVGNRVRPGISSLSRGGGRASTNERGHGSVSRGSTGSIRRARGSLSKTFNSTPRRKAENSSRPSSPAPGPVVDLEKIEERLNELKPAREARKRQLIADGLIADPEKKTTLDNAITPIGSCTDMCPELERLQRIRERATDPAERLHVVDGRGGQPSEALMVKRFRRSAAGNEEQLPEDIRTPETLQKTLDYLLDKIIGGGERLITHQKYVWDRTRAIRNDFSIQQVTRPEDVKIAVDCYERIARFHILCLHLLSNEANVSHDEHFDAHQEREQLNNTLLSLMYYYDDNRQGLHFPHEAEFKAYCVLFELQSLTPDLEDRMQSWPSDILNDARVQTARKLYIAAGNTEFTQGPLRPFVPSSIAQANSGKFWTILDSPRVSYMMACVAEMNFSMVRFTALDAVWRSAKKAPEKQQPTMRSWTISGLTDFLGFDDQQRTFDFCGAFGLSFKVPDDGGEEFLDFKSLNATYLDKSSLPSKQIYSESIVEVKRCHRTVVAVINGISVAEAVRRGFVEDDDNQENHMRTDSKSMFFPADTTEEPESEIFRSSSPPMETFWNPQAPSFQPRDVSKPTIQPQEDMPKWMSNFGGSIRSPDSPTTSIKNVFGQAAGLHSSQAAVSKDPSVDRKTSPFGPSFFQPSTPTHPPSLSGVTGQSEIFGRSNPKPQPDSGAIQASSPPPTASSSGAFLFQAPKEQPPNNAQPLIQSQDRIPEPFTQQQPAEEAIRQHESSTPLFGGLTTSQPKSSPSSGGGNSSGLAQPPLFAAPPSSTSSKLGPPTFIFSSLGSEKQESVSQSEPKSSLDSSASNSQLSLPSPAPLFPQESISQTSATATPPQNIDLSTVTGISSTTQSTPKRPSRTNVVFPSVSQLSHPGLNPLTNESPGGQIQPSESLTSSKAASKPSTFLSSSFSGSRPRTPEISDLEAAEAKRRTLIESTARIGLTQRDGILESFIQHKLSEMLYQIFHQDEEDKYRRIIARLRSRFLSRKFLTLWREFSDRKRLRKRAETRRKMLATRIRAEQDKQRKEEAEMEEILEEASISKQFQEQWQQKKEGDHRKATNMQDAEKPDSPHQPRLVGQKRKSIADNTQNARSPLERSVAKHKRSRTMGESEVLPNFSQTSHKPQSPRSLRPFSISNTGSSFSLHNNGFSPTSQRLDKTRTDYFRLKAMGIDPDTPLVPDTAQSLAIKQQRHREEREAVVTKVTTRPSSASAPSSSKKGGEMSPPPKPLPQSKHNLKATESPKVPAKKAPSEDVFLQQLREANRAMSEGTAWFKEQSAGFEKENERTRERRESLNHSVGSSDGMLKSTNGFARSLNGYEYVPPTLKPGQTLSQTEQRIRQTGAHGFANRPLGGQPKSDYKAIPMSRRSALMHSLSPQESDYSRHSRKRSIDEVEDDTITAGHREISRGILQQTSKRSRVNPQPTLSKEKGKGSAVEPQISLAQQKYADEAEDESEADYNNGTDGGDEIDDDGIEEDEEEEEDELDEESVSAPNGHYYMGSEHSVSQEEEDDEGEGYETTAFRYTRQSSKATTNSVSTPATGPGASVADAIELSD